MEHGAAGESLFLELFHAIHFRLDSGELKFLAGDVAALTGWPQAESENPNNFWSAIEAADRDRLLHLFQRMVPASSCETEIAVETGRGHRRFAVRTTARTDGAIEGVLADVTSSRPSDNLLDGAFRFAATAIHIWRGIDDPVLERINDQALAESRCGIVNKIGMRAAELLAHDPESWRGLQTCLHERRTIELQPVPYVDGDESHLFAVRHVFIAPDAALTFARALAFSPEDLDALRAAEQKYRSLIESVDVVVWQADPETIQFVYVGGTMERFGYTAEQAMQPGFWISWLHPDDRESAVSFCKEQVAERRDHSFEYRVVAPDGSVQWVRDVIAVRMANGKMELFGVFVDITDTRMAQEERRFEHLLLLASFESSNSGLAVVTPDGSVAFHNHSLLVMLGLEDDPAGLIGHPLLGIGNDEACDSSFSDACEIDLPNGRIAVQYTTPISGTHGESLGQLISFRDITERRQQDHDLREREAHFRSLIEHTSDVISVMDPDANIEYKSPSVYDVLGFTVEEMLGTSMYAEVVEEDGPLAKETVDRVLRTGIAQQAVLRARHKNGSLKYLLVVFSKLETKDGSRIVANARDITERKMLETTLEQSERMTSLGHLATTIAHEMNNVLMAIQPNAEYLARITPDDARLQRVVRNIEQSVRRGSRITQEILRFTKPIVPRLQPVDVTRWLTDLAQETTALLGAPMVLTLHLPQERLHILGDKAALNQALTNILLNARDAMNGRGGIDIAVEEARDLSPSEGSLGAFVRISIHDKGPGMPRHVAERIFEPLFSTKERGMGLGLGVVHQIVTAHRGLVHVETAEGEGTTFHLYLPRSDRFEAPPTSFATQIPDGLRVLIVEDELAISTGLTYILSMEGADVRVLDRGAGVRELMEEFRPAIVVLDVSLPDMSGSEIFAQIRARWPAMPVIFSTGHADAGRLDALLEPPLVDVALKPYETSDLLVKIRAAINIESGK